MKVKPHFTEIFISYEVIEIYIDVTILSNSHYSDKIGIKPVSNILY